MGSQRVRHDWATFTSLYIYSVFCICSVHSVSVIASKTGLENMAELRAMCLFSSSALHCTHPSRPSRALDHCRPKQRELGCLWGRCCRRESGPCLCRGLLLSPESGVTLLQATEAFPATTAGPACCWWGFSFTPHCQCTWPFTGASVELHAHLVLQEDKLQT